VESSQPTNAPNRTLANPANFRDITVCLTPAGGSGRIRKGNQVRVNDPSGAHGVRANNRSIVSWVIEKERARNGRSVEVVGTYNPRGR